MSSRLLFPNTFPMCLANQIIPHEGIREETFNYIYEHSVSLLLLLFSHNDFPSIQGTISLFNTHTWVWITALEYQTLEIIKDRNRNKNFFSSIFPRSKRTNFIEGNKSCSPSCRVFFLFVWIGKVHWRPKIQFCSSNSVSCNAILQVISFSDNGLSTVLIAYWLSPFLMMDCLLF